MTYTEYDEYHEGWTAAIEYDLKDKTISSGVASTFDATGMTAGAVLKDKDGNSVDLTSKVEWADQSNSRIRLNPAATTFESSKSPYKLNWKVTDGSSKVAYYPQGAPIQIKVYS